MKKIITFALISLCLTTFSVLFLSCEKDESNSNNQLPYIDLGDNKYTINYIDYSIEGNEATVTGANPQLSLIYIPEKISIKKNNQSIDYKVTTISASAFSGHSNVIEIKIPNSIDHIGNDAFYNCLKLETIILNNNYILSTNHELKNLFGPQIKKYVIGDDVTIIGDYAFYKCSNVKSIVLGKSVKEIGRSAFFDCTGLTSIELPNSLKTIHPDAFSNCSNMSSISIPSSVSSIGANAFEHCENLKKVIIQDIAAWCNISFSNNLANPICYSNSLYIDNSKLTSIEIPNTVTSIGDYTFSYYTNLNQVIIPESVMMIGNHAFEFCTNLTSLKIPNSVKYIGFNAFDYCRGMQSLTIPSSVTNIADYAFEDCSSLQNIYTDLNPQSISLGRNIFWGVPVASCILHVKVEYLDLFKSTYQWMDFWQIEGDYNSQK